MRINKERQQVLSLKVTSSMRALVERLAATLTLKRKEKTTMTDVMELAIAELAKKEKIK